MSPNMIFRGLFIASSPKLFFYENPIWLIIKLFPARESLVSDIPAGDEKIANLFLQCTFSVKSRCAVVEYGILLTSSRVL